jgi:hypothetical protein
MFSDVLTISLNLVLLGTSTHDSSEATTNTDSARAISNTSSSNLGPIVGGVIGGVTVLGVLTGVSLWYRRKQQQKEQSPIEPLPHPSNSPLPPPYSLSPPLMEMQRASDRTDFGGPITGWIDTAQHQGRTKQTVPTGSSALTAADGIAIARWESMETMVYQKYGDPS